MAWMNAQIELDGVTYLGHRQGLIFSMPASCGLKVGGKFSADGASFEVTNVTDLHGRGETFVLDVKEVKNDKPKTRGNAASNRKPEVQSEDNDGHDNED